MLSVLRWLVLLILLCGCDSESNKTSSQSDLADPNNSDDQAADKSMGVVYSIVWDTSWDMSGCSTDMLVLQIDTQGNISLFIPPNKTSSLNLLVLPTAVTATCSIGDTDFVDTQASYRDVLATTDISCVADACWQHEGNSLNAYVSAANEPAAGESWVKKSGNRYLYLNIASAPIQKPRGVVIKLGSARMQYDKKTHKVTVRAIVVEDGHPKSGVSVVYSITCPKEAAVTLPAVISNARGVAKTSKVMEVSTNGIADIDAINFPTCKLSAAINGKAAVDIVAAQPVPVNKVGIPLRVDWGMSARIDSCNAKTTNVTIIGLHGDGSLKRVYSSGRPNVGAVNLLLLPTASSGARCTIGDVIYSIDATAFDSTTTAANMGCNAKNCWQYDDKYKTHYIFPYSSDRRPAKDEKWVKKTGNGYVFHIVQ